MNIVQYIEGLEDLKIKATAELNEHYLKRQKDNSKQNTHNHVIDEGIVVQDTSGGKKFGEILKQNVEKLDSKEYIKKTK